MMFGDEPFCTCGDGDWITQCLIDGEVVDEVIIDSTLDPVIVDGIVNDSRDKHFAMAMEAEKTDQHWRVEIRCPKCRKGAAFDKTQGVQIYR